MGMTVSWLRFASTTIAYIVVGYAIGYALGVLTRSPETNNSLVWCERACEHSGGIIERWTEGEGCMCLYTDEDE